MSILIQQRDVIFYYWASIGQALFACAREKFLVHYDSSLLYSIKSSISYVYVPTYDHYIYVAKSDNYVCSYVLLWLRSLVVGTTDGITTIIVIRDLLYQCVVS